VVFSPRDTSLITIQGRSLCFVSVPPNTLRKISESFPTKGANDIISSSEKEKEKKKKKKEKKRKKK
jgi:hypothetical protein